VAGGFSLVDASGVIREEDSSLTTGTIPGCGLHPVRMIMVEIRKFIKDIFM
jgi:hypothetical protein